MRTQRQVKTSRAFALPTVLIASVVLLSILALSVTATATVRTALKNQYYNQLAQVAGEAGVAYAKSCLAASGNVPGWSDSQPLTPASDCSGNVNLSPYITALVVAGGGSGGGSTGGGGGAGGVVYNTSVGISATAYPVVVGSGGAIPGNQTRGISGANSSFNGLVAIGGGGGGHSTSSSSDSAGYSGGSGGGGQNYHSAFPSGNGTEGQGYAGGPLGIAGASGGGGASGLGAAGSSNGAGGNGGPGVQYDITGSMLYYAAGGGGSNGGIAGTGGSTTPGPANGPGASASANTGNGGTGGWAYADGNGGAGGSGVVVISFPVISGIIATGGTVTTVNGNEIHKFTSNGTFTVSSIGSASCPSAPVCSVTVNRNVRSSFSVPKPTVDSQGRALTIQNSGYVEITRDSNGAVWRTYTQPGVQAAVVPDLCSGNATSSRGWNAAVKTTGQDSLSSASGAQTISLANTTLNAGVMYFRKDFNISSDGSYDLNVYTPSSQDSAVTYIDGQPISTATGALSTVQTTLTSGCHTMVVALTNDAYSARASDFTASLTRPGAATPIVVTDTSWRVTTGDPTHFSTNNYFEGSTSWEQAVTAGIWNDPSVPWGGNPANWGSYGDVLTEWITTNFNAGATLRPPSSYALFRQAQPFTTNTATTVRVASYCDDSCNIYLDGNFVLAASTLTSKSITIQPGTHTFGVRLYNGGAAANPAAFLLTAVDLSTNKVLARSNIDWDSTTSWSTSAIDSYSYDATYQPVPAVQSTVNTKVLVVGGGGGGGSAMGGGGGGGGVVYDAAHPLSTGTYRVTVGGGGSGAPAGLDQVAGSNGSSSRFDTLRAYGGGGGGSYYNTNASPPGAGASAGGSAGAVQTLRAAGVIGQGYDSVATLGSYYPTGGGGAGGPGATGPATGGVGVSNSILGSSYFFGGGGGGSGYTGIGGNGGNGGGGGGAIGSTTGGSGLNNGSNGPGGATVAQANVPGGNAGANTGGGGGGGSHYNANNYGGNGGSGIVVISVPSASMTVSAQGATITSSGGYTIYRFNSSGTFTVVSTDPVARNVNIVADYSQWTLSGGASYSAGSGQLTMPAAGTATSPLIKVDSPTSISIGGNLFASTQSPYVPFNPDGGYHVGIQYYGADGVTLAQNSGGFTGNGCAKQYPLNAWIAAPTCAFSGGPNVIYIRYSLYGSNSGYASPGYLSKSPQAILQ